MKPIAHSLHAAVDRRWLLPLAVGSALSLLLLVALTTFPSPSAPSSSSALFVEHKLAPSPPSPAASLPRIAFLISGSAGDASALRRVLLALYHPRNRYILHLDAEAPDSDRSNLAADLASHPAIAAAANVRVVDRANLVTYRGPTMVRWDAGERERPLLGGRRHRACCAWPWSRAAAAAGHVVAVGGEVPPKAVQVNLCFYVAVVLPHPH
ncbi:Beta-glucuronosyltransferase GlcAT14B [Zea mays]|uniref:Beta-glucuronosyltransferase GlcAT14B n=1 Tax=Zea mays TaxID=4577 RepID=A0A1D6KH01_MAIZE|nr:Beta-glucuronosyltransferase GlcAT14B [Zea mays]